MGCVASSARVAGHAPTNGHAPVSVVIPELTDGATNPEPVVMSEPFKRAPPSHVLPSAAVIYGMAARLAAAEATREAAAASAIEAQVQRTLESIMLLSRAMLAGCVTRGQFSTFVITQFKDDTLASRWVVHVAEDEDMRARGIVGQCHKMWFNEQQHRRSCPSCDIWVYTLELPGISSTTRLPHANTILRTFLYHSDPYSLNGLHAAAAVAPRVLSAAPSVDLDPAPSAPSALDGID